MMEVGKNLWREPRHQMPVDRLSTAMPLRQEDTAVVRRTTGLDWIKDTQPLKTLHGYAMFFKD